MDFISLGLNPKNEQEKWMIVKRIRNKLLLNVGWVTTSSTLTDNERDAGLDYIQALKDIPQDFINPDDVVFPTPPEFLEEWVNL